MTTPTIAEQIVAITVVLTSRYMAEDTRTALWAAAATLQRLQAAEQARKPVKHQRERGRGGLDTGFDY